MDVVKTHLRNFVNWLKAWDRHRTIFLALIVDMLQAEIQVMWFITSGLWQMRDRYFLQKGDFAWSGNDYFLIAPDYFTCRTYFIGIGALSTKFFVTWLLLDGMTTGITSHVRAGIFGNVCSNVYIVIGGFALYLHQFMNFNLRWWVFVLFGIGFSLYVAVQATALWLLWWEVKEGTLQGHARGINNSLLIVLGIFICFIQAQLVYWSLFNVPTVHLKTHRSFDGQRW